VVTIAVSTVISAFNSPTLSPARAAILLKPRGARRDPLSWLLDKLLGWFFRSFNWVFGPVRPCTCASWGLSEDLPMVIEIVDCKDKIDELMPHIDGMLQEGLVTLEKVQVIKYRGNE
jgi:hypothetical protein